MGSAFAVGGAGSQRQKSYPEMLQADGPLFGHIPVIRSMRGERPLPARYGYRGGMMPRSV